MKDKRVISNLTYSVTITILVITFVFFSLTFYFSQKLIKRNSKKRIDHSSEILVKSLQIPLWNIDNKAIEYICNNFYQYEEISSIKVYDNKSNKFIYFNNEKNYEILASIRKDIIYQKQNLGSLEIIINKKIYSTQLKNYLKIFSLFFFILTVSLILSVNFYLRHKLYKPVFSIVNNINQSISKKTDFNFKLTEFYEFNQIGMAFENLQKVNKERRAELINSYKELQNEIKIRKQNEKKFNTINKELEYRVQKRTKDLTKANKKLETSLENLEQLSFSIAHGLRSPLRGIFGMARLLKENYQDILDNTGLDYLNRLERSSSKINKIFSRVSQLLSIYQADINPQQFNLSKLFEDQIDSFSLKKSVKIDYTIEPDFEIIADRNLFKILLFELISNSVKFSHTDKNPKIIFNESILDNNRYFKITDYGIGFDKRYKDKLFKPFQTLHQDDNREIIGLGLTIVKRIIEMHNGEIFLESKENKKTSVYLRLP